MPELLPLAAVPIPRRKRWTRSEVYSLRSAGFLAAKAFELIEGEIVEKVAKNPMHVSATRCCARWAETVFGAGHVRTQDPVILDPFNEPEPDIAITEADEGAYHDLHPTASELLLVIEVSDATLLYDLEDKARLYGRSGVREYWVLDVAARRLHVHREPNEGGGYASVLSLTETQQVAPLARPDASVLIARLLLPQDKLPGQET